MDWVRYPAAAAMDTRKTLKSQLEELKRWNKNKKNTEAHMFCTAQKPLTRHRGRRPQRCENLKSCMKSGKSHESFRDSSLLSFNSILHLSSYRPRLPPKVSQFCSSHERWRVRATPDHLNRSLPASKIPFHWKNIYIYNMYISKYAHIYIYIYIRTSITQIHHSYNSLPVSVVHRDLESTLADMERHIKTS